MSAPYEQLPKAEQGFDPGSPPINTYELVATLKHEVARKNVLGDQLRPSPTGTEMSIPVGDHMSATALATYENAAGTQTLRAVIGVEYDANPIYYGLTEFASREGRRCIALVDLPTPPVEDDGRWPITRPQINLSQVFEPKLNSGGMLPLPIDGVAATYYAYGDDRNLVRVRHQGNQGAVTVWRSSNKRLTPNTVGETAWAAMTEDELAQALNNAPPKGMQRRFGELAFLVADFPRVEEPEEEAPAATEHEATEPMVYPHVEDSWWSQPEGAPAENVRLGATMPQFVPSFYASREDDPSEEDGVLFSGWAALGVVASGAATTGYAARSRQGIFDDPAEQLGRASDEYQTQPLPTVPSHICADGLADTRLFELPDFNQTQAIPRVEADEPVRQRSPQADAHHRATDPAVPARANHRRRSSVLERMKRLAS